ncbi:MAG: hypothetical protein ACLSX5_14810 [Lachnospiraceae bacterium]
MKKKQIVVLGLSALLAVGNALPAYAGHWYADRYEDWYYKMDDGTSINNGWHWINGKCYLFNDNKIYRDTITPDGYSVNQDGAWTVDGVVQIKENENPDYCKDVSTFKCTDADPVIISTNITDCGDYYDVECEFYPYMDMLIWPAMEKGHVRLRKSAVVHFASVNDNGQETITDMTLADYAKGTIGQSETLLFVRMDKGIVQDDEGYVIEFHDTNGG